MPTPRTRGRAAAPIAALAVLLIAGCAGPRPAASPRPVRIALHSDPLSLDPHFKNEALTFSVLRNVYEGLTVIDANGGVQPALAVRWENPDDVRWRFVLRADARFHDGRPLHADDVVASLERARNHPRSNFASYLVEVASIAALDARTVEITTGRPYPILLNKLAFVLVVPRDAPAEIVAPIGTGRYRLRHHRPGDETVLDAFAEHWRGPAAVPAVTLVPIADGGDRVRALLAGEVDLVSDLDPADAAAVEASDCCRLRYRDGLVVEYLVMRATAPPFDEPRVRQAIDLAIDRQRLVDDALDGRGLPLGQMVGINVFGYDPALPPGTANPEAARALLAAAGYGDGLELTIEMRRGRNAAPIAAQLAAVGIRLEVVVRPWEEMHRRLTGDQVDFYFGGVLAISADASDIFDSVIHSRDPLRGYGQDNFLRYTNPALDRLIETSGGTLDMMQRRSVLRRAMALLREDAVYLPLYTPYELFGTARDLAWQPRLDGMVLADEIVVGDDADQGGGGR